MLKRIPLPVTGVALGFAALGNLIQSFSAGARSLCGLTAAFILALYLLKMVCYPASFTEDMKNPITASVFCTFPMALMLLSGYLKPFAAAPAAALWYAAVALHAALIVFFTVRFMLKFQIQKVFASYFIVYVGIAAASVSAPAFQAEAVGTACFWFALVSFLFLLALVTYRYLKYSQVPEPAQPLFCIYTAPAALCLAGYIQSVAPKSASMIYMLGALALALYAVVLFRLPGFLRMKFYPSYAAFTFPFVISAIAVKQSGACLAKLGAPLPVLGPLSSVMTVIAAALTVYALARFIAAVCSAPKA